jgi:hypothetical protein
MNLIACAGKHRMNSLYFRTWKPWLCAALMMMQSSWSLVGLAAEPKEKSSQVDDIVEFKEGGFVRGTIIELVPNDHVVLLTPSGEKKTFKMAEVKYAGSVSKQPHDREVNSNNPPKDENQPEDKQEKEDKKPEKKVPEVKPQPVPATNQASISFRSNMEGVTLMERGGQSAGIAYANDGTVVAMQASHFRDICVGPCTGTMSKGHHFLGVRSPKGYLIGGNELVEIKGPSTVDAKVKSKANARTAGMVLAFGGAGLIVLGPTLLAADATEDTTAAFALTGVGLGLSLLGCVVFFASKDSVTFEVTPLAVTQPKSTTEKEKTLEATRMNSPLMFAQGLGLRARF